VTFLKPKFKFQLKFLFAQQENKKKIHIWIKKSLLFYFAIRLTPTNLN
jgi:hypothetical protein